ncbi:TPA: adenosylhomocysteinase [Candidatus Woesearchaeota archaeon]|nr:adenosylhomocysteinase [Candidatus Woesearchaeota archaeon]
MDTGDNYEVKEIALAQQGEYNIAYAESEMKALLKVRARFEREKPLKGLRIGLALHVTKETAALVKTLMAGGASVAICSCNPLSTQDDVAAALAKSGVAVYAYKGEGKKEYYRYLNNVIKFRPQVTIDDGCDLVTEIHTRFPEMTEDVIVGCEETSTGVIRLMAMEKDNALKYPMIAVNSNKTKHLFDNYYGTGQSTIDGILRATNVMLAGKCLVVAGYGQCSKGIALRAKGMGANVIVTEVNPLAALQAKMDGFRVMPMLKAARLGQVFVTATGDRDVIRIEHVNAMPDGAILANSGHFDVEIDVKALEEAAKSKQRIRHQLDEYVMPSGKKVYLIGEGRLCNLASAEGHPSVVMSTSFCGQALAVEYGVKNKGRLKPGVHNLPEEIDMEIARLQLEALGVKIDTLTDAQSKYLASWKEGT